MYLESLDFFTPMIFNVCLTEQLVFFCRLSLGRVHDTVLWIDDLYIDYRIPKPCCWMSYVLLQQLKKAGQ